MVALTSGELERGNYIPTFKQWMVGRNFFVGSARGQQVEDVLNANFVFRGDKDGRHIATSQH